MSTHASRIFRAVPPCTPDPFAAIVPAIPLDTTCVVLTGSFTHTAARIVAAATTSAAAPCAYVRCVLPIFSAIVTMIRLYPIVVPSPSASAVPNFTHRGTNWVAPASALRCSGGRPLTTAGWAFSLTRSVRTAHRSSVMSSNVACPASRFATSSACARSSAGRSGSARIASTAAAASGNAVSRRLLSA